MTTILCFGDSNTHGTRAMHDMDSRARFPKPQRWPDIMASHLGETFEVIAEGHPGRTAVFDDPVEGAHKNGLTVLPALLETHRPVDLLIVMLGTNDLKARFNAPPIDIALGLERLAALTRQMSLTSKGEPTAVLYLAPVPIEETGFLAEMFVGGAAKSRALPRVLEAVAKRQGAHFLDLSGVTEVDPIDGIHLSADGQAAIAQAITSKVKEILSADRP